MKKVFKMYPWQLNRLNCRFYIMARKISKETERLVVNEYMRQSDESRVNNALRHFDNIFTKLFTRIETLEKFNAFQDKSKRT